MKIHTFLSLFFILCSFVSKAQNQPALIPFPKEYQKTAGNFVLSPNSTIYLSIPPLSTETEFTSEIAVFKRYLKDNYNIEILVSNKAETTQIFIENMLGDTLFTPGTYFLDVNPYTVKISSPDAVGVFYAFQTLIQLLPLEKTEKIIIPCCRIRDEPRYKWRGMHLDCCRHFFSKDFVKKYIDILAMYKMNTFHWHLTDDQGWRVEIKKYPKLTQIGAWRKGSMVGHFTDHQIDTVRYGGFYTQEEIKEVVQYAAMKHITIVPEIEMPGHSLAALAAYPEYSCTGNPTEVGMKWGVETNVFCPKEETFVFLENILTEVMELFPGEYIHVGGDEVPKDEWKKSAFCQELIKKENLKDEHGLQSYFIKRIEKFVNAKGRQIIGWDEILEGGLAPNAAVMSWRGLEGGLAAAKQKHFAVMCPGSHCYFDHYQGNPKSEPVAIGGYTTVEKTYSYDPTPEGLSAEESYYILGAQGNLWTEYIATPEHLEYMALPRMSALSEVLWSPKESRNYDNFKNRLLTHFSLLDKLGIRYAKSVYELKTVVAPNPDGASVAYKLSTIFNEKGIRYSTDGSEPTNRSFSYSKPIEINKNTVVKSAYFEDGLQKNKTTVQAFSISKSTGRNITLTNPPSGSYKGDGAFTLVNGVIGSFNRFDNDWLGFSGENMEAVIDFGKTTSFKSVALDYLDMSESWIYPPKGVTVWASNDGKNYTLLGKLSQSELKKSKNTAKLKFKTQKSRYLKVLVENTGRIPAGNPGENEKAWLFVDEIMVD